MREGFSCVVSGIELEMGARRGSRCNALQGPGNAPRCEAPGARPTLRASRPASLCNSIGAASPQRHDAHGRNAGT